MLNKRQINALLKRGAMDKFDWNNRIIEGTDGRHKVFIGAAYDHVWGDCLSLSIHLDHMDGLFYPFHLSPARARLLAEHLLFYAAHLEKENGKACIDKHKVKKVPILKGKKNE